MGFLHFSFLTQVHFAPHFCVGFWIMCCIPSRPPPPRPPPSAAPPVSNFPPWNLFPTNLSLSNIPLSNLTKFSLPFSVLPLPAFSSSNLSLPNLRPSNQSIKPSCATRFFIKLIPLYPLETYLYHFFFATITLSSLLLPNFAQPSLFLKPTSLKLSLPLRLTFFY